jgi:NDP-sugar pyrophosphorylase family protein
MPGAIGWVNAGLLIVERSVLNDLNLDSKGGWEKIIDPLCAQKQVYAYRSSQLKYSNVGTPEEYSEARAIIQRHADKCQ